MGDLISCGYAPTIFFWNFETHLVAIEELELFLSGSFGLADLQLSS